MLSQILNTLQSVLIPLILGLLVVGAGITGAGVARDAAMRGLRAVSYTHLTMPTKRIV